ncbi:Rpn family recombination-promoting nuclease/putative transposase [Desulfosporosinus lacus]|uniref:Transposase (putative) YhgA-like domain-containing protein n=1 Tax=Desulfosporosinus lacus DSM 15449 TaxID=1121420 RepID=A0A1M5Z0P3_9FIRM|nr:Rpn family recombination-promoting nuclease/putative transposase [Desulfosporosinus lacus]SHI17453.1 conserved hypothetical protein (putative transposase or invertase) [Desulfosporosinus lacus DSM 15449]
MCLIHKPHDKFFKETLSDIGTAKDFLQNYLPQEILDIIDLETITPQKDSNDLTFQPIYELAKEISLERSEAVMTIAEKLITEGMEKGMEKGKLEVAENLLRLGLGIDMILKATGLTEDEVRDLMN